MSCCSIPTAVSGLTPAKNEVSPQLGQGQYIGVYYPGSSNAVINSVGQMMPGLGSELVIQNTNGYISSLNTQPQNVLRFTGANGNSYIQATRNLYFTQPYSGSQKLAVDLSNGNVFANGGLGVGQTFTSYNQNAQGQNGLGGQGLINQFYSFTLNGTSTITSVNLAVEPIGGGASATLRMNFYDGNGVLRWAKDFT